MSGLDLLERVKKLRPQLPMILITAAGQIEDAVDAIKRGAFQYVTKPCDANRLRALVVEAARSGHSRPVTDAGGLRGAPTSSLAESRLVGDGPAMRALQLSIDRVAASIAPVLVTGETGVGKELVARAIHARSARSGRPFIAVNASAVQESLFESEVFGHARGAFTGAVQSRAGLLTEADGGSVFLDEIGDMPSGMQAKLLRVLQFGEVRPVGSDRSHRVDVRIIAATHRDIPALVRADPFRERSLLSPERSTHYGSLASRASRRHPGVGAPLLRSCLQASIGHARTNDERRDASRALGCSLARKRPRTGKRHRTSRRIRRR